jgi:hypothetical protein
MTVMTKRMDPPTAKQIARRASCERDEREQGFVLVLVSLSLIVLIGFAAIAVDVGGFYSRSIQAQRAADAASTAGVVFLPNDFEKAERVAKSVAKDNGFDEMKDGKAFGSTGDDGIRVIVERGNTPRRLKVTVRDSKIETGFGRVFMESIDLSRSSVAEYVNRIPLGSAYNAIGTGSLPGHTPDGSTQGFWLAVNGFCTAKEDGDLRLSRYDGNRSNSPLHTYHCDDGSYSGGSANPVSVNADYGDGTAAGANNFYEYVIDVPCVRADVSIPCDPRLPASPVHIEIYNPAFDLSLQTGAETATVDATPNPASPRPDIRTLPSRSGTDPAQNPQWEARWDNVAVTTEFRLYRPTTDPNVWNQTDPSAPQSISTDPFVGTPVSSAVRTFATCDDDALTLARPACTPDDSGWYRLATVSAAGRWKVRVTTQANQLGSYGVNSFALRASSAASFAPCDSRNTPGSCPSVSGDTAMSVQVKQEASGSGSPATFFLSRLGPADEFRGKRIQVSLWDPGERMQSIEILNPSGQPVSFDCVLGDRGVGTVNENADNALISGCPTSSLNVSGSALTPVPWTVATSRANNFRFNDRLVQLIIDVPTNYGLLANGLPDPAFDGWWKIRYTPPAGVAVFDRTTWQVDVVGDPVHLIRR